MLRHLRVTNFSILSDVSVEFTEGLNVLTGETGAGKSLIVEAVNLLRGGRASADIPRSGAKEAVVEAIFEVPDDLEVAVSSVLDQTGVPTGDREVMIRRVIQRGGRSRTYINGALTPVRNLQVLGRMLVDLSGQHQHQGLVDPSCHLRILDAFGDNEDILDRVETHYERVTELADAIAALTGDEAEFQERLDYLAFQLRELTDAQIEAADANLETERARLRSVDQLRAAAAEAENTCYSQQDSVIDLVTAAVHHLEAVEDVDDRLTAPAETLRECRALVEDAASGLREYLGNLEFDGQRFQEIEARLALIQRLERKHATDIPGLIDKQKSLQMQLETMADRDDRLAELQTLLNSAQGKLDSECQDLRRRRKKTAKALKKKVEAALDELGMPDARLDFVFDDKPATRTGADALQFLLAANPGEGAKPLGRIASGGELSRIMLALKLALRTAEGLMTYVFDEVDTGIGGPTAEVVGRLIRSIASQRQVLCVTHLPQIAAFGDAHFHVSKYKTEGRTETQVEQLTDKQRQEELARMVGGAKLTKQAKAHAAELLKSARDSA